MRECLTPEDICNQISMNRTLFDGTILISEGVTDKRLYDKFIVKGKVRSIPAYSKNNVRKAVSIMKSRNDASIIGIVDKDLDDYLGKIDSPPLFQTDMRDMEMMILHSRALDDLLAEYADWEKLDSFEKKNGKVITVIESNASELGLLMYVSIVRGYNFNFKDLDFYRFIDKRTLSSDRSLLVKTVIDNTAYSDVNPLQVVKDMESMESKIDDKSRLARGHDSVKILLIGLKYAFGSFNAHSLNEGSLGGVLRLAFSHDDFRNTELYKKSSEWADSKELPLWEINRS